MNTYEKINRVLKEEANAILDISEQLKKEAEQFVELCYQCEGKVIFTGMGKSGHVAKKISATFASLGTPSFYIHPGEAAHGDLGMLEKKDILIMVSNSGETDELIQLINSVKIIGCKLLGIFCKKNSTLEKYCDVTVVLPIEKEACVNNLAPTTSTTVTMAFGDAVAVTLSEMKNFKERDFALFHPRGTLGKKLLVTVESVNGKSVSDISVQENKTIEEVLWLITKNGLGAAVVTDNCGNVKGLVSDGDIRRCLEKKYDITKTMVTEIMTIHPLVIHSEVLAADALYLMQEKKKSVLPIVDQEGKLTGMISLHDIVSMGIKG